MQVDIERYIAASARVDTTGIDWQPAAEAGLSEDELFVLSNFADQENQTIRYLRMLLVMALVFSGMFELRHTYFLIAGIAGIAPTQGTLGSAAWARYLIDWGIQWEIDPADMPAGWTTGYLGINTKSPDEKPPLDYRTEVFQLDEKLLQKGARALEDRHAR